MAYGDGLENRCPRKGTVGSNPTPSAISNYGRMSNMGQLHDTIFFTTNIRIVTNMKVKKLKTVSK